VFTDACRLGAAGIVSEKVDGTYRAGPYGVWIKLRNPASIAVQRGRSAQKKSGANSSLCVKVFLRLPGIVRAQLAAHPRLGSAESGPSTPPSTALQQSADAP
jgi:phage tail protein X